MKNLAIIPIRSGSQRIKNKNIKLLAGHPLFYYQVENAKKVKQIDKIVVASDDVYYLDIAIGMGVETLKRPSNISNSFSRVEETLLYVIKELESKGFKHDNLILMQATSPLTQHRYIDEAIELMETKKYKSIIPYYEDKRFFIDEEELVNRPRTQDKKPRRVEAGNFWVTNIDSLKETQNVVCSPRGYIKVPSNMALDIDLDDDMMIAEMFLKRKVAKDEKQYFQRREYVGDYDNYYKTNADPDGVNRDLKNEQRKKIDDCKTEIAFINNLYKNNFDRNFLDLGCGLGYASSAIDNRWNKYGLETSSDAIEIAKKYIPHIHKGDLKEDTYPEEFFDAVLCYHVIEHVKNPIPFIKNIHKILKTHGHLIVGTPNFGSDVAKRFGKKFRLLHDSTHISLFTNESIQRFLEDFGFQINKIEYPFFETPYFTKDNLIRLFDTSKVSPPSYGNIMTLFCQKK